MKNTGTSASSLDPSCSESRSLSLSMVGTFARVAVNSASLSRRMESDTTENEDVASSGSAPMVTPQGDRERRAWRSARCTVSWKDVDSSKRQLGRAESQIEKRITKSVPNQISFMGQIPSPG